MSLISLLLIRPSTCVGKKGWDKTKQNYHRHACKISVFNTRHEEPLHIQTIECQMSIMLIHSVLTGFSIRLPVMTLSVKK